MSSGHRGKKERTLFSILRSLQDSKKIAAVVYALQWPLELARPAADRRKQSLGCGGGGNLLVGVGKSQKKLHIQGVAG